LTLLVTGLAVAAGCTQTPNAVAPPIVQDFGILDQRSGGSPPTSGLQDYARSMGGQPGAHSGGGGPQQHGGYAGGRQQHGIYGGGGQGYQGGYGGGYGIPSYQGYGGTWYGGVGSPIGYGYGSPFTYGTYAGLLGLNAAIVPPVALAVDPYIGYYRRLFGPFW
jgi:hypothetical protein